MTLLESLVSLSIDALVVAGLLSTIAFGLRTAATLCGAASAAIATARVEQLADDAVARAAAGPSRVLAFPQELVFRIDDNADGRFDSRSTETVTFKLGGKPLRLIHGIGQQFVALAPAQGSAITYYWAGSRPVLAQLPVAGGPLVVALPP